MHNDTFHTFQWHISSYWAFPLINTHKSNSKAALWGIRKLFHWFGSLNASTSISNNQVINWQMSCISVLALIPWYNCGLFINPSFFLKVKYYPFVRLTAEWTLDNIFFSRKFDDFSWTESTIGKSKSLPFLKYLYKSYTSSGCRDCLWVVWPY